MTDRRLARLWAIQVIAFRAMVAAEAERAPGGTAECVRIQRRRHRARSRVRRAERLIARAMSVAALDVAALAG